MSRFDGSNHTGVFHVRFQHRQYYYFTEEKRQVSYPSPLNRAWKDRVLEAAANVFSIPSTRARPGAAITINANNDTTDSIEADCNASVQPSPKKRPRIEIVEEPESISQLYWPDSPEARQVFKPTTGRRANRVRRSSASGVGVGDCGSSAVLDDETAKKALERRIALLQSVNTREDGWRDVIMGRDIDNYCTKVDIFEIRQRSTFLCCAYKMALSNMNRVTWHDCCKRACQFLNSLGLKQATFFKTVANWNKIFRKFECFPHPNPYVQCGKRPLPKLLELYPDAKDQIVSYGIKNLATLTIESVHDFIMNTVVPRLTLTWSNEHVNIPQETDLCENTDNKTIHSFLNAHGLESMSLTTTWRWMCLLGFCYDTRKKCFYVDGHERHDVVATRSAFCKRYLTDYEPYCRRWVHVSVVEAKSTIGINVEFGFRYHNIVTDTEMLEFHIDYWRRATISDKKDRQDHEKEQRVEKEPTTSIRVSLKTRPLMIVGQDESVFAQYLLGSKTWVGPKGQRPLLPKSEGDGYMLSAFVSREFGFGRELSVAELDKVNGERRGGNKTYIDKQAAMEILKSTQKPLLTESPLVKYLYIGANNEGYWNSFHMSLQFEDVVDCLLVLYPDFDFVFLFDHSQGHGRKRDGALNAMHMSRTYGGAQPIMRDSIITKTEGFLGPHLPKLSCGDTQFMVFLKTKKKSFMDGRDSQKAYCKYSGREDL
jgi:hypothetical protein